MKRIAVVAVLLMSTVAGNTYATVRVELARACKGDTKPEDKSVVQTVEAMVSSTGPDACIDKSTRVTIAADSISIHKNKFGSLSIDLLLTPEGSTRWVELQKAIEGQEMVLLSGQAAVLYLRVFHAQNDGKLTLFAANESEAQQIARLLEHSNGS
jgi:hypothetical protein